MRWWLLLLYVMVAWRGTASQPVSCIDDDQCDSRYYCEVSLHMCRECLSCEELKREPSVFLAPASCIKSVTECGPCQKGLVVDQRFDVNGPCVPPLAEAPAVPVYVWVFLGVAALVLVVAALTVRYCLRNSDMIKVFSRTSLQQRFEPNAPLDPPPSYNPEYGPVRPESPPSYQEESAFVKSGPPPSAARETERRLAANVYNRPAYERKDSADADPSEHDEEEMVEFPIHDENTSESLWTPDGGGSTDNNANGNARTEEARRGPLGAQLAAARDHRLLDTRAAHLRQDTNNNGACELPALEGGERSDTSRDARGNFLLQHSFFLSTNLALDVRPAAHHK